MSRFAQTHWIAAVALAAASACASNPSTMTDGAVADSVKMSDQEFADILFSAGYVALYMPGNDFEILKSLKGFDVNKYEFYALLKSPGSIYDNNRFAIAFYRDSFSITDVSQDATDKQSDAPKYWAAVHFTSPWDIEFDDERGAQAKREIFARRKPLTDSEFAVIRSRLNVDEFAIASKKPDDGVSTTHLNEYAFDLTRNGVRDIVYVGWEGFDRFGSAASTLDAFIEFAVSLFPELTARGVLEYQAPSSSSFRNEVN